MEITPQITVIICHLSCNNIEMACLLHSLFRSSLMPQSVLFVLDMNGTSKLENTIKNNDGFCLCLLGSLEQVNNISDNRLDLIRGKHVG